ncbi:DUF4097 family beta strand repeat-containing protein [Spirillospora sp. CA-294931]|uniref:DUF4097 family beta strand repeat-containing protein n=1 Tax=Spirillospora sp. CA-294931 TaxID=3240042 RepID=UPI003D8E5422
MSRWTIEEPTTLDFDGVVALRATLIAGSVSVLPTDDRPSIQISAIEGPPLVVTHDAGMLTVTHERLLEGVLAWLRTQVCRAEITVMVPHDCPVSLNLVSADAVLTGLTARSSIKSGTGDVTLDGVTGEVDANTVSGAIEAQGLDGRLTFASVSGDLSLADGLVDSLAARTVSGKIAADVELAPSSKIEITTVSGEVALRVPATTGAAVALNSAAGRLESSFPGLTREDRSIARTLGGTIGDGSAKLTVGTVSGAVTLLVRPGDEEITAPGMEK